MKRVKRLLEMLALISLPLAGFSRAHGQALPQVVEPFGVPSLFNPNETQFQHETHFLTFLGNFIPESAQTATAYYNAIDPTGSKRTFQDWLKNAGFISDVSQWNPTGPQKIACNLPGCDYPAGTYGYGIINTDAHAIVLNAADLGFVRNQFIRCKPSCTALNPTIYTYLENYPVAPFAQGGTNFSNLLHEQTPFPTQAEAAAAIRSALTRPLGTLATNPVNNQPCTLTKDENLLQCSIQRIADVAFEWAAPATNPTSSTRFGQLYAYIFSADGSGNTSETINVPAGLVGLEIPDFVNRTTTTIGPTDPFPPNLDFLGFKQHPGVCFICHGGKPQTLDSTGAYPRKGNVDGFRFLPLDNDNLLYTSDHDVGDPTSRAAQEPHVKVYNKAVLITTRGGSGVDDQGTLRAPHEAEVIRGWYAGYPGDITMSAPTQNPSFIPKGWREPVNGGTAPAGSEKLYLTVVAPSCRSCHFARELSLDFGTAAAFRSETSVKELALLPMCQSANPKASFRPMPLAHLTYQRFWQTPGAADLLAQYFGYADVNAYCRTQ